MGRKDEAIEVTENREAVSPVGMPRREMVRDVLKDFRRVVSSIKRHSQWVEAQCGMSGAQLWAMWELVEHPGLRVSELARALAIHQSTASNLLDKLERKGLVRRERGGPDQRVVHLHLTTAGLEAVGRAPRPAQGVLSDALRNLPDGTLDELQRSLGALVSLMRLKDEEAALKPLSDI